MGRAPICAVIDSGDCVVAWRSVCSGACYMQPQSSGWHWSDTKAGSEDVYVVAHQLMHIFCDFQTMPQAWQPRILRCTANELPARRSRSRVSCSLNILQATGFPRLCCRCVGYLSKKAFSRLKGECPGFGCSRIIPVRGSWTRDAPACSTHIIFFRTRRLVISNGVLR